MYQPQLLCSIWDPFGEALSCLRSVSTLFQPVSKPVDSLGSIHIDRRRILRWICRDTQYPGTVRLSHSSLHVPDWLLAVFRYPLRIKTLLIEICLNGISSSKFQKVQNVLRGKAFFIRGWVKGWLSDTSTVSSIEPQVCSWLKYKAICGNLRKTMQYSFSRFSFQTFLGVHRACTDKTLATGRSAVVFSWRDEDREYMIIDAYFKEG